MKSTNKETTVVAVIKQLGKSTELSISNTKEVERAFMLGVWYRKFPEYMLEHLSTGHNWDLDLVDKENTKNYSIEEVYPNLNKFQFFSETGTSWHQCYRDLRQLGWERVKVGREGGRLHYLMRNIQPEELCPPRYNIIHLLLEISIATCKQVQVGIKTVEQPIYETQCEDLREVLEDEGEIIAPVIGEDAVEVPADTNKPQDEIPF